MKILFVDDEPAILRTIRRTLRGLPAGYQLDLESDPARAMERLTDTAYDLVVSDMRMPGSSGYQVLERAATLNPGSVRAVLSGYSGEEETAKVLQYAHVFIGKPFEPAAITELVARVASLLAMPVPVELRRRIGGLRALPYAPKLFVTLTRALAEPGWVAPLDEIGAALSQDEALASKAMRLAQNGFCPSRSEVTELQQAVRLLGIRMIAGLVLHHEVFAGSTLPVALSQRRQAVELEGLMTAELAARLARHRGMTAEERDEVALGGLLHDVGRLMIAAQGCEDGAGGALLERERGDALCRREEQLLGAHHGWVGAYLLRLWGFSQTVVDAVAWHHRPSLSGITGLTALTLVHVADALLSGEDEPPLDHAYLADSGCLAELPDWLGLAGRTHSPRAQDGEARPVSAGHAMAAGVGRDAMVAS